MTTLMWIVRILVILLLIRMALRLLFPRGLKSPRPSRGPELRSGGTLVRDPHCGTYLPQSRALTTGSGESTLYFCSAECRDAYTSAARKHA
jgi:YHS domain-containing protein